MPADKLLIERASAQELVASSRINAMIVYLQEHLDEPMSLQELAQTAGYSPYHIHRLFSAYVGETLACFVRRLKLGRAARQLIMTDFKITEIAMESGYQTPASFTKAFRQMFGETPSQVRKSGKIPDVQLRVQDISPVVRSNLMQPEIRELSAKKLIAVEKRGLVNNNFNRAADQAFTALNKFVSQNRLFGSVEHCLGICPDDGVSTDAKDARYIAAYFLRDGAKVWARGDVMELEFPAGRYAVFTHKGPYENLWQTWNRIYRDWLPSSGEQLRDAVPFEVYINEKSETPPEKLLVEIFVPIQ